MAPRHTEQSSLLKDRQQEEIAAWYSGAHHDDDDSEMKDRYQPVDFNDSFSEERIGHHQGGKAMGYPLLLYRWCSMLDRDAIHFGARLTLLFTLSALFIVVQPDGREWPEGQWVVITVLFVSWFPRLDAASVIEKSIQRIFGTLLGGLLGLFSGLISLQVESRTLHGERNQGICLLTCFAAGTFMFCFLPAQIRLGRTTKIIQRYNYACILCNLTFIIVLFPFYGQEGDKAWIKSVYRLINVFIGCLISVVGSIIVLPRSTNKLLHERIQNQCQLAGQASEAVLHAAADVLFCPSIARPQSDSESDDEEIGRRSVNPLHDSPLSKSFKRFHKAILDEGNDVALEKYESALQDWKVTKGLFSLLQYDPFHYLFPPSPGDRDSRAEFRSNCADTLARALRIQTTVALLDGIIRNEPPRGVDDSTIFLLAELGTLTRELFTIVPQENVPEIAINKRLLLGRLSTIRQLERKLTVDMASPKISREYTKKEEGITEMNSADTTETDDNNRTLLLFLQLVEHLILRCLSLYDAWMKVEEVTASSPGLTRVPSFAAV